jgi:hypothetical protein
VLSWTYEEVGDYWEDDVFGCIIVCIGCR